MFNITNFHSINSNKWMKGRWRNWKNIQPCSKFNSHMFCSFNTVYGAMKDFPFSLSLCVVFGYIYILFFFFTFFTQNHIVLVSKQPWNQTKFPWLFVGDRSALYFSHSLFNIFYFDLVFVTLIYTTFPVSSECVWGLYVCLHFAWKCSLSDLFPELKCFYSFITMMSSLSVISNIVKFCVTTLLAHVHRSRRS